MEPYLGKGVKVFTPLVKETFKKLISFGSDLSHIWDE